MSSESLALREGFQLEPLTPDDLDAVAAIETATQITPWSRKLFADCLASDYLCQVVRQQEQVVAFQVLSFVLDESHLLNIAVAPLCQRRGLARAMLMQAFADAAGRGIRHMYLEVRASNHRAQALYASLGFVHFTNRRNYYRTAEGHEDAWLMLKAL